VANGETAQIHWLVQSANLPPKRPISRQQPVCDRQRIERPLRLVKDEEPSTRELVGPVHEGQVVVNIVTGSRECVGTARLPPAASDDEDDEGRPAARPSLCPGRA